MSENFSRRDFLKLVGTGAVVVVGRIKPQDPEDQEKRKAPNYNYYATNYGGAALDFFVAKSIKTNELRIVMGEVKPGITITGLPATRILNPFEVTTECSLKLKAKPYHDKRTNSDSRLFTTTSNGSNIAFNITIWPDMLIDPSSPKPYDEKLKDAQERLNKGFKNAVDSKLCVPVFDEKTGMTFYAGCASVLEVEDKDEPSKSHLLLNLKAPKISDDGTIVEGVKVASIRMVRLDPANDPIDGFGGFENNPSPDEITISAATPEPLKQQDTEVKPVYIEIKPIGEPLAFEANQNGIYTHTAIVLDKSMVFKGVDKVVENESFPGGADAAMAKFTQHFFWKVAIETNENAKDLTYEEYISAWKKYNADPNDSDAKAKIEFTFYNDATGQMETRTPMDLEFVFGSAKELEGLNTYLDGFADGMRIEYNSEENKLKIIRSFDEVTEATSYKTIGAGLAKSANYLIKYKGKSLTNFNYVNIDESLRDFFATQDGRTTFRILKNGKPASVKEAQQNPWLGLQKNEILILGWKSIGFWLLFLY